MLIDWIGTSFCEVAIDEEWSYVSGRMDDKSGIATCYSQYFVMALVCGLQSINHLLFNDRKFTHRNFQIND
jgi:hypothetical protein